MSKKNSKTTIAANNSATQIADLGATSIAPAGTMIADEVEVKTLAEIKEGEVIDGYTVCGLINDGGEASIRFAEKDGKKYAIKIFRRGRSIDKKTEDILAAINSPYVMPVLARGEVKGVHYQILPYYKNGTYGDLLGGKKVCGSALKNFISNVNEGLRVIHGAEIFHNDIKPENVFISDDAGYAVIGDFGISKFSGARTSVTNVGNMSQFYAAPEADELSTVEGDYFSFGMSVLTVAYGKNVFEGMSVQSARREIISGRIPVPEKEIGEDVCDLISMLTRFVRGERITYDGVCKWLKDPKCYRGCRKIIAHSDAGLQINEYMFAVDGKNEKFYDAFKLAEAMNNDQKTALQHYNADFIQSAINSSANKTLALELQKIRKKYSSDPAFGLFLTLHAINPYLSVKFDGAEINNFKDYIDVLLKRYPDVDRHFADSAFIDVVLNHSNIEKNTKDLIQKVRKAFKESIPLYDTFLNLFGNTGKFFYGGTVYESFGEFLDREAFTEDGVPRIFKWENLRDDFLLNYLSRFDADEETVKTILSENDKLFEYFRLGKLFNGYLPFRIAGKQVRNLYDFIAVLAIVKEKNSEHEIKIMQKFLSDGGFEKIECFEVTRQKKLVQKVKKASNKISYIYYHCYKDAKFLDCKTLKEFIVKLGTLSGGVLEKTSESILKSEDFKIWLEAQGVLI